MKYQEIKSESEKKVSALITECHVFFAFSNEQFTEGMKQNPLQEGEKYVSIGMGGYCPKSQAKPFLTGMDNITAWEKAEIKKYKQIDECIKFELYNHECFYSCDPSPVFDLLPYSKDRILKVYHEERKNANKLRS